MKYKAVIFDLDGTLVDSAPDIHRCVNMALKDFELEEIGLEQTRKAIGPAGDGFRLAILKGRRDLMPFAEKVELRYRDYYWESSTELTRPFARMEETLIALKESGARLGVATNKPLAQSQRILDKLSLSGYMDAVLGPESVERAKPAGDMVLAAVEQLDGSADMSLMVGDTDNDSLAGRAAGVDICMVTYGYMSPEGWGPNPAEFVINSPDELVDVVCGQHEKLTVLE